MSVTVLAATLIFAATTYIAMISPLPLDDILFECISAFSTVGLSTGITADLPPSALMVLCILMFVGRVGPLTLATALAAIGERVLIVDLDPQGNASTGLGITVATALALGGRERPYRYPEENPIVG